MDSHRVFNCAGCSAWVVVCTCCDRGNKFCADGCAAKRRREVRKAAEERYRKSDLGRRNNAARQRKLAETGTNLGRATQHFVHLLDTFGAGPLEQAIRECLANGVTHHHSVRQLLEQQRHAAGLPPSVKVDLPDDDRVRNAVIPPPDLSSYDQIGKEVGRGDAT